MMESTGALKANNCNPKRRLDEALNCEQHGILILTMYNS